MIIVPQLTGHSMRNNWQPQSGPRTAWHLGAPRVGDRVPGDAVRRANELPVGPQPRVRSRAALSQPGPSGRNLEMYNVLLLFHDETNVKTKNV